MEAMNQSNTESLKQTSLFQLMKIGIHNVHEHNALYLSLLYYFDSLQMFWSNKICIIQCQARALQL